MSSLKKILMITLGMICISLIITVSVPAWRQELRNWFINETPIVLKTIKKDFFDDGRIIVFAKIKSSKGLFIEVYEKVTDGIPKTISKIRLPDDIDAYSHIRGEAKNLALEDVDGDGVPEIIAPTFDANQVAHLNVYTYNPSTKQFEALLPSSVDN